MVVGKSFFFQPFEETCESGGVLTHGDAFSFQFNGVLLGLVDKDRRLGVDFLAGLGDSLVERFVDARTVVQHRPLQAADIVEHRLVRLHIDAVEVEVVLRGRVDLVRIHKQRTLVRLEHHIGNNNGIVFHVITSYIEQPCYLIKGIGDQCPFTI